MKKSLLGKKAFFSVLSAFLLFNFKCLPPDTSPIRDASVPFMANTALNPRRLFLSCNR